MVCRIKTASSRRSSTFMLGAERLRCWRRWRCANSSRGGTNGAQGDASRFRARAWQGDTDSGAATRRGPGVELGA
eukprot:7074525-Prymnesium_polylepis.1